MMAVMTGWENRRYWLAAVTLALAMPWCTPAAANWSATLPLFAACSPAAPPELPARWRAVGLMLPLLRGQIDVAEFVYDGTIPAMRATVYWVKSGAVDLLITDNDTYILVRSHHSPTQCMSLGSRFHAPTA